jgi:Subtilase family
MPTLATTHLRRALHAAAAIAAMVAAGAAAAPAAHAEVSTPQAIDAHAEFLAYPATPAAAAPAKVCVVDTGVDLTTDAAPAVIERYSEFGGTVDDTGAGTIHKHGTYVAGMIASQRDNRGAVGIWPQARIISVRVFDSGTSTTVATYLAALDLCRTKGAKVINLSLSGLATATGPELDQLENWITSTRDVFDINVVAAAGNNGAEIGYPAKFPAVFAVGASDTSGNFCSVSSRGPELDLSALGCGVQLSMPGDVVGIGNGTSFATPVVSGVLAALRSYRPDLSALAAEDLVASAARTMGSGKVLDATAAFRAAGLGAIVNTPAPSPPATAAAPAAPTVVQAPTVEVHQVTAPAPADPLAALGVRKPRVRTATYRGGVLRISVSGVPDFASAVFTVDKRHYTRASGSLRLKLKRVPKRVSVLTEVPDVGRTAAVKVKVKAKKAAKKRRR